MRPFHYYIECYVGGFCGMILKQHLSFARHMVSTSLLQLYSLTPRLFLLLQNSLGMRLAVEIGPGINIHWIYSWDLEISNLLTFDCFQEQEGGYKASQGLISKLLHEQT